MGATSLYSLSRDAVVANQFIETSQQSNIPGVVIHQYAGGNEFITTGILIENATYTQKFTIKITGDITARQFIEVP